MQKALQTRALNKYTYNPKHYKTDYSSHRVYEAIDQQTNEPVYIKSYQLRSQNMCGPMMTLSEQAQLQLCLYGGIGRHGNIQGVHRIERSQHCLYLVMERGKYISNRAQNSIITNNINRIQMGTNFDQNNNQDIDYGNTFSKFIDVVTAVCYLRSNGYIHCGIREAVVQEYQYQNGYKKSSGRLKINKIYKLGGIEACFKQNDNNRRANLKSKFRNRNRDRDRDRDDCNRIMAPEILCFSQSTQKSMIWDLGILLYFWIFNKMPVFNNNNNSNNNNNYNNNNNNNRNQSPVNSRPSHSPNLKCKYTSHSLLQTILLGCLRFNAVSRFSLNQLLRCILNSEEGRQFQHILLQKVETIKVSYTVPQAQWVFEKYNKIREFQNQLDFIRFLSRTCYLIQKSQQNQLILQQQQQLITQNHHIRLNKLQQDVIPIEQMTRFIIKCRLKILDKKISREGQSQGQLGSRFKYQLQELQKQFIQENSNHIENNINNQYRNVKSQHIHHTKFEQHKKQQKQTFQTNPQYKQFQTKNYNFNEYTYLQYQSYLRQYILQQLTILRMNHCFNSISLSIFRYTLYSIDFAISIFELNQEIIQKCSKHNWRLLGHNNMGKYAQESVGVDLYEIYCKIVEKVKCLGIDEEQ